MNPITLSDMIGTLGAVGITTEASNYRTAMQSPYTAGELTSLATSPTQFALGLNGDYTTVISAGFIHVLQLVIQAGNRIAEDVASSICPLSNAKIGQIETACANLMSRRNVNDDIQVAIDN